MSSRMYGSALLLWLTPLLLAVGGRGCGTSDEERLQGRWIVVEMIGNGVSAEGPGIFFIFDHGRVIGEQEGESEEGWYRLYPDTEPKGIDMGEEDEVFAAIYALDGDELTLCMNEREPLVRPTSFTSTKESRTMVLRLKRVE